MSYLVQATELFIRDFVNYYKQQGVELKVDQYGSARESDYYIRRQYGKYIVHLLVNEHGFELSTYKDLVNDDPSNFKIVKTNRGLKNYLVRFLDQ